MPRRGSCSRGIGHRGPARRSAPRRRRTARRPRRVQAREADLSPRRLTWPRCVDSARSEAPVLAALFAVAIAGSPVLAADVTTPFAGKAVNGRTVTHEHREGRHVLRLSDDFKVPGSPDPHWQVIDSLEGARHVIATAIGEARRLQAPGGVIAVVDDGGDLIALERLDGRGHRPRQGAHRRHLQAPAPRLRGDHPRRAGGAATSRQDPGARHARPGDPRRERPAARQGRPWLPATR